MSLDRKQRRVVIALAIAAVLGTIGYLAAGSIGDNLVYYWSPTELTQAGERSLGASIRLGGLVAPGTIDYGSDGRELRFSVTDGETEVPVRARSVPPAMFRENIGVVLEGTMTPNGVFETRRLMVKHDNEYRPPHEQDPRSMEQIMKTLQVDGNGTT